MKGFLVAILCFIAAAEAQILKHTFDVDTEGWLVMGTGGGVKRSLDAKSGKGALEFSYSLDGAGRNTLVLPLGEGKVSAMKRLRFWVKADHDAALAVVLSEKKPGGGDYAATLWAPKDVWQQVDLALSDFQVNDGPTDAVDSDGRLDPEQVEGIGVLDLSGFFNQAAESAGPMYVTKNTGGHRLLVDDFEILTTAAAAVDAKAGRLLIDSFDRGFLQWFSMGGVRLRLAAAAESAMGTTALEASTKGMEAKLTIVLRRVNGPEMAGAKRLEFDLAAEREATLAISIETKKAGTGQGPRYYFLVYPPGERKAVHINVSLADFEHDENSPADPAGKLEAGRIKTISIGDITALAGGAVVDNRLWIGKMEMVK